MARRSKKGFHAWLAQQQHRQDSVGIVAREFAAKRPWIARLLFGPKREVLATGSAKAMSEYDRLLK